MSEANSSSAFVSANYVNALLREFAEQGLDPAFILAEQQVDMADVQNKGCLDAAHFGRLFQAAIVFANNESLGMVSVGPVMVGTFRMMCLSIIHRPCLTSAVRRAGEFLDVCQSAGLKPALIELDHHSGVGFAAVAREPRSAAEILGLQNPVKIRTTLYLWHSLLSWLAGRNLPLRAVYFEFDEPERSEPWRKIFSCPVIFNGPCSMLSFEAGALGSPNIQNEASLAVFLKYSPYRLIVPSYYDQKLSDRILALFGDDFRQPLPTAQEVGQQLGMSLSTLRRQLGEEGTSFQRIKDESRRDAACQYLARAELSLLQVSSLLGFDESSAFFRAFKRWTGKTPSEYRADLAASRDV